MFEFCIENHEVFGSLTQNWLQLDKDKIYQRNVQSSCHLAQLFLDTSAVILQKKREIVGEIFSPALEMQFVQFY